MKWGLERRKVVKGSEGQGSWTRIRVVERGIEGENREQKGRGWKMSMEVGLTGRQMSEELK